MQTEEELVIAPDNWFEYEPGEDILKTPPNPPVYKVCVSNVVNVVLSLDPENVQFAG